MADIDDLTQRAAKIRAQILMCQQDAPVGELNYIDDDGSERHEPCALCFSAAVTAGLLEDAATSLASERARADREARAHEMAEDSLADAFKDRDDLQLAHDREATARHEAEQLLRRFVAWREGPEGPEILFKGGANLIRDVRATLAEKE